jgi:hypothetical protein
MVVTAVALAAASLAVASPARRAGSAPARVAPCAADVAGGVTWRTPAVPSAAATPAYRIVPLLDASRSVTGQRVSIGTLAVTAATLDLPPESFVTGPFGRLVLVGADDGRRSTLRIVDALTGCVTAIATSSDVIRRATIAADSGAVYEFRVERATRADLGVWRRAAGNEERVLPPLEADDRYGITFSTELSWSTGGDELVVQSCDASLCRARIVDVSSDRVRRVETEDQGDVLALIRDRLVTYGACRGLPCRVHAFDVSTGADTVLSEGAGGARVATAVEGVRIVHEHGDGRLGLVVVDPQSGVTTTLAEPAEMRLAPQASRSNAAVSVPDGWVPLVADQSIDGAPIAFLRLADGSTVDVMGVVR